MPPKKTEKGGKGASTTGPKSGEEPPQPGPGAPYCLSLVLEVSLDVTEPRSLVDTSAEGTTKPPGESSDDDATFHEEGPRLVEPEFRYTFVNGERITTPSIGRPGSSWVKLDTAPPQQQSASASLEVEDARKPIEPQAVDEGPPNPIVWRYTRVHQLQGADDDEVNTPNMRSTVRSYRSMLIRIRPRLPYMFVFVDYLCCECPPSSYAMAFHRGVWAV